MTTSGAAEDYMRSILGQQNPLEVSSEDSAWEALLQVDSLWNRGLTEQAQETLLSQQRQLEEEPHVTASFHRGLEALLHNKLEQAYTHFAEASRQAPSNSLEAVFLGERAVNIAFWMACSGKMLAAAEHLDPTAVPFAGGVLGFAQYMSGDIRTAQETALGALSRGFVDPWTFHAVAHCLHAAGQAEECIEFLDKHRQQVQSSHPSAFMKGHMEFHQALCFVDLEDSVRLEKLIEGHLWRNLSEAERTDYWNAAGLLNVLWKAELHDMKQETTVDSVVAEALEILMPTASAAKSPVFSLCILRWTAGATRLVWKEKVLMAAGTDNRVLQLMTQAVDLVYPTVEGAKRPAVLDPKACQKVVEERLQPVWDDLDKLGASPEQREVLEDFVMVIATQGEKCAAANVSSWRQRNYRPNVAFYKRMLPPS